MLFMREVRSVNILERNLRLRLHARTQFINHRRPETLILNSGSRRGQLPKSAPVLHATIRTACVKDPSAILSLGSPAVEWTRGHVILGRPVFTKSGSVTTRLKISGSQGSFPVGNGGLAGLADVPPCGESLMGGYSCLSGPEGS